MIATKESLLERVNALPNKPGVYIFRNAEGRVVYVGKAAALRNRVRSYFGSPHSMEPKVHSLALSIAEFDYIVTNTAQEALHLEATLVKRHQPIFNVRLKDDKHSPIPEDRRPEPYPRVEIARRIENDGAATLGPMPAPAPSGALSMS
jgi:excinuclease ABC subunit C